MTASGPALLWVIKSLVRDVTFIAKWLHEVYAQWRIKGIEPIIFFEELLR